MSEATAAIIETINQAFRDASNQETYGKALRRAKRLPRMFQLELVDEIRYAAFRLNLDAQTGLPTRRVIKVRGRDVTVEHVS